MSDQQVWSNIAYPLASCTFLRDGYAFVGWNTMPDGSGEAYTDRASVVDLAQVGETAVLYAQWKIDDNPVAPDEPTAPDEPATPDKPSNFDKKPLVRTGDNPLPPILLLVCLGALIVMYLSIRKLKHVRNLSPAIVCHFYTAHQKDSLRQQ